MPPGCAEEHNIGVIWSDFDGVNGVRTRVTVRARVRARVEGSHSCGCYLHGHLDNRSGGR